MSDLMNYDKIFFVKNLIDHTVIANSEFVKSCKLSFVQFWLDIIQIHSEPIDSCRYSTRHTFIQLS